MEKSARLFFTPILLSTLIFFGTASALASPAILTYQGRILKSDGTALEHSAVSFIFQILDSTGACLIYQEQFSGYNMVNSGGVFDVPIGTGGVQFPLSGTFTILDAFNNSSSFACGVCSLVGNSYSCANSSGNYVAAVSDTRKLRVSFYDGTAWKVISPDSVIRSVPFAGYSMSAQKLGDKVASDFVLKTGIPTCPTNEYLNWNGTNLVCSGVSGASGGTVTSVTSTSAYLSVANGTVTPQLTLNVGTSANTVAAGNDARIVNAMQMGASASGDLSGNYPGPTVVALQGVGLSAIAPNSGQVLKYNGTNWGAANLSTSDIAGLNTSLGSYLTQSSFNSYVASANCSSNETMYWNSVSSNFLCKLINVGIAGDVTGSIGASKVVALQNNPVDTLAPSSNQVLQWNGSKWTPASLPAGNSGTVTSVSGTGPISVVTGSSTPVISISQASTSSNGYLSSADWNAFNGKQASGNYITALSGDVTAAGAGTAAATVAKLQGSTLTIASPSTGQYLKYNGTAFVNSPLSANDLSGSLPAANLPAFTGDVSSTAGSSTLTLATVGTAGTYYKVTTDSKGRVTSGANSLGAADIPNLDWSKITTGKPTTLSEYGIVDSLVKNGGGVGTMSSGLDASKPASPAMGDLFVATDTQKIYRYSGSAWTLVSSAGGTGGTVTSVSSANSDINVATGASTPVVTLNSGTSANQILKLDVTGKIPAVDGSQLTNLLASQIPNLNASKITSGILSVSQGGTGQSTYTDGQLLIGNTSTSGLSKATLTAGTGVAITNGNGTITIAATGGAGTVTNVTGSAPISVATGNSTPVVSLVNGTAAGQVYRWNGSTAWTAAKLTYTDLINALSSSPWPTASCTSGQAVTWSSVSDSFVCSTLSIATSQLTGSMVAAQMPAFTGGDVTSSAGSLSLNLSNSGVIAGSYSTVTVDAKGRVTAGSNPTTLAGYGITDAMKNLGGTPGIQTGLDASKPVSPSAGTIYFATDTLKIYQYFTSAWNLIASANGAGGTITALTSDVSASGVGSVAATVNSVGGSSAANIHSAELAANAASSANTSNSIVKRDASGNFSAATVSANLTGNVTGNVTGSASLNVLKAGDTMAGNLNFSANKGTVFTDSTSKTVTLQAPTTVSANYVLKLPTAVATSSGQILASDISGNLYWTTPSTTATSYSGVLPIANGGTGSATTSQAYVFAGPTSGSGAPSFRALASTDLPAGILTGAGTMGYLPYYTAANTLAVSSIYTSSGKVGIGAAARAPSSLDVNGTVLMKASVNNSTSFIDFSAGNLQHTSSDCGTYYLTYMQDGGSYTLAVKGSAGGTCAFNAYSGYFTGPLTVHMPTDHAATIAGKHTLYTFLVMGGDVYVTWMPGL